MATATNNEDASIEVPTAEEAGAWLVEARRTLVTLRESDDKRLSAAGEAWTAAFGAMIKLLQLGEDPPEEQASLHALQMSTYMLQGAEELRAFIASKSAALPPEAATLALNLSRVLKDAMEGKESALAEGDKIQAQAQAMLEELGAASDP